MEQISQNESCIENGPLKPDTLNNFLEKTKELIYLSCGGGIYT